MIPHDLGNCNSRDRAASDIGHRGWIDFTQILFFMIVLVSLNRCSRFSGRGFLAACHATFASVCLKKSKNSFQIPKNCLTDESQARRNTCEGKRLDANGRPVRWRTSRKLQAVQFDELLKTFAANVQSGLAVFSSTADLPFRSSSASWRNPRSCSSSGARFSIHATA